MNKLKEFAETDWYGWAGAERFEDGSEPLIYCGEVYTVIVDKTGIGLYLNTGDCQEGEWYHIDTEGFKGIVTYTKEQLIAIGEAMIANN